MGGRGVCGSYAFVDEIIEDMRTLLAKLEQANVLIDAEAMEMLRKVNA